MKHFHSFMYDLIASFKPELVNGLCFANFRLSPKYRQTGAPFGFDWVRIGDSLLYVHQDLPYKGHMGRNFTTLRGEELVTDLNRINIFFEEYPEMYEQLCRSYAPGNMKIFPSHHNNISSYHVPVLSLFPYDNHEDNIAHLTLEIEITAPPRKMFLKYDKDLFKIEGADNLSAAEGYHTYDITVACTQEFSDDQYIYVMSVNKRGKEECSGLMRVCRNAKPFRKELSILMVNVKFLSSEENDAAVISGDTAIARQSLHQFLRHALITPKIETIDMDLGYRAVLKSLFTYDNGTPVLTEVRKLTRTSPSLLTFLTLNLFFLKNIDDYDIIIYCLGTKLSSEDENGQRKKLGGYNRDKEIVLSCGLDPSTPTHEVLHALGLSHTFNNVHLDQSDTDFTYEIYLTDNLMDYSNVQNIRRLHWWEWQWKRANANAKPEK